MRLAGIGMAPTLSLVTQAMLARTPSLIPHLALARAPGFSLQKNGLLEFQRISRRFCPGIR